MDEAFQSELLAMQDVGRDRSRTRSIAFGLAWLGIGALLVALRYGGIQIGLIYIAIISASLAGGVAVGVTKMLTPGFIKRAAQKHGIPEDKLRPDKYLID